MTESTTCTQCGQPLTQQAVAGHCPKCLLQTGLDDSSVFQNGGSSSKATAFEPPAPHELADFIPQLEIKELIGKGGMGAVYKARQISLDRWVAVKILSPAISDEPTFSDRFTREARALGKLNHPNIVAIHDFGTTNGLYYIVMEYVEGTNLRQLLRDASFDAKDALAIVPQLCDALQYAHEEGVIHRDIKPENILLDKRGRVKIADFGLAKLFGHDSMEANLTETNQVMGTVKYMAPEQMEGAKDIDHRADIYSLGVVFYEMLTGELPLGRFSPPSRKVQIDIRLDEVVMRALEKQPNLRYQHAEEVKTEVESVRLTPAPNHNDNATSNANANPSPSHSVAPNIKLSDVLYGFGDDLDQLNPYFRWVLFPTSGFAFFWIMVMLFVNPKQPFNDYFPNHANPVFFKGELYWSVALWVAIVFFLLTLNWYIRRCLGWQSGQLQSPWNEDVISQNVVRAGQRLKVLSGLSLASSIGLALLFPWPVLCIAISVCVSLSIFLGGHSLCKLREPNSLSLILGILPLSPASIWGTPLALDVLTMIARQEVKGFLRRAD
jgi:serine/threonine protein kinase